MAIRIGGGRRFVVAERAGDGVEYDLYLRFYATRVPGGDEAPPSSYAHTLEFDLL